MMRIKAVFILLLMLLCITTVSAQIANGGYYISNYQVQMTVHDNNTYAVTEDIDMFFTEQKHGIYRMIPIRPYVKRDVSDNQDGSQWEVKGYYVDVDNVRASEEFAVSDEDTENVYTLRLGSADKLLEGSHHYQISYLLHVPWDRVNQADLFFYSILGSGWNCSVEKFSFTVHFDKSVPQHSLDNLKVFTGENGDSTNIKDKVLTKVTPTDIAGIITGMRPYEALTVYIPLPEGYFTYSVWEDKGAWIFAALAIIILVITLVKEIFRPAQTMKVMTVSPPEGLTSAEVGTLFDCRVDDCDLISLIPYFASKGYLTIDNTGEHPVLRKVSNLPKNAPNYQKTFFNSGLFASGNVFDTSKKAGRNFGKAWYDTKDQIEKGFKGKLDNIDQPLMILYIIGLVLSSFAVGLATCMEGFTVGALVFVAFGVFAALMVYLGMVHLKKRIYKIGIGFLLLIYLAGVMFAISDCWTNSDLYIPKEPLIAVIILLSAASIFIYKSVVMSPYRRQQMGEILGLEEFIRLSEEPQLRQLQAEEERYFYNVLPYAVAFGMSEVWAKKFANIIVPPNSNFVNNGDNTVSSFYSNDFANNFMTSGVRSGIKAEDTYRAEMAAKSSSGSSSSSASSFSGGGFSGGGFGGGGGGAW